MWAEPHLETRLNNLTTYVRQRAPNQSQLLNQSLLLVLRVMSPLRNIYHFLLFDVIGEVLGDDVGVGQQDIADGLEEGETENCLSALRNTFDQSGHGGMRNSPLRIVSCSCRRSEGRDTPACGWFQSSDWAARRRRPRSRRTRRAQTWPGTREPGEDTGLRCVGGCMWRCWHRHTSTVIWHQAWGAWFLCGLNTRSRSPLQTAGMTSAWSRATEAIRGDQRLVMVRKQLPSLTGRPLVGKVLECDCCFRWCKQAEDATGDNNWPPRTPDIWVGSLHSWRTSTLPPLPPFPTRSSAASENSVRSRPPPPAFLLSAIEWLLIALRPLSCPSVH